MFEMYHCEGVCGRGSSCSSLTHLRMPSFPFIALAAAAATVKAGALFILALLFSFHDCYVVCGGRKHPFTPFPYSPCYISLPYSQIFFLNVPLGRVAPPLDFSPFEPTDAFL